MIDFYSDRNFSLSFIYLFAGWLFDVFGNYDISFLLLGAVQALAVMMLFLDCLLEYRN